jgi:hypothetical protein
VLGAGYARRVLPGLPCLPYDEPSHWSVVKMLGAHTPALGNGKDMPSCPRWPNPASRR